MPSTEERLAVAETEISQLTDNIHELHDISREQEKRFDVMEDKFMTEVASINQRMSKQQGFMGGVIFTISALWAFAIGVWHWISSNGS